MLQTLEHGWPRVSHEKSVRIFHSFGSYISYYNSVIPNFDPLVSVVVAFFVCWAPFHCQRLLAIYAQGTKSRTLVAIYDMITHASGILYYLSTCINPVLYNIMSNKFRQAFKVSQIILDL